MAVVGRRAVTAAGAPAELVRRRARRRSGRHGLLRAHAAPTAALGRGDRADPTTRRPRVRGPLAERHPARRAGLLHALQLPADAPLRSHARRRLLVHRAVRPALRGGPGRRHRDLRDRLRRKPAVAQPRHSRPGRAAAHGRHPAHHPPPREGRTGHPRRAGQGQPVAAPSRDPGPRPHPRLRRAAPYRPARTLARRRRRRLRRAQLAAGRGLPVAVLPRHQRHPDQQRPTAARLLQPAWPPGPSRSSRAVSASSTAR